MQRRILVVDDDADTREIYSTLLEHYGFAVDTADNGASAFEAVADSPPDLVIMDLDMPVMDGSELARELRARGRLPLILCITGRPLDSPETDQLHGLCDGMMRKPIEPLRLIKEMHRLFEGARSGGE